MTDSRNEIWPMDELHRDFEHMLRAAATAHDLDDDAIAEAANAAITETLPDASKSMIRALKRSAPRMLRERRAIQAGFEKGNLRRWRAAFDLFEMTWVCAEEIGANFNAHFRPAAVASRDYVFEALTHLHATGLLVASEALCLMKGGHADGALSRWRTLYEVSVIASFIAAKGQDVAVRYLAHADVRRWKAATEWNGGEEAGELRAEVGAEIESLKARADAHLQRFGPELGHDHGWASAALGMKRPTFVAIEAAVDMGHSRPVYRWACLHNHGAHRDASDLLGTSESEDQVLLVGSSNSGMAEPLTLIATTLSMLTATLLLSKPNFDRLVACQVLSDLSDRVGTTAKALEAKTMEAHQRKIVTKNKKSAFAD